MKVFVVGSDAGVDAMWYAWGATMAETVAEADLIQFTGGEDVSPHLYGQHKHESTYFNLERDMHEAAIFKLASKLKKPMVGICRGGQFLNVMCGGSMWQDVTGHATGKTHKAFDTRSGEIVTVTSTHHQMMIPGPNSQIILTAEVATRKVGCGPLNKAKFIIVEPGAANPDIEALFYADKKVFCFQPHPEYGWITPNLAEVYMDYIQDFFGLGPVKREAIA